MSNVRASGKAEMESSSGATDFRGSVSMQRLGASSAFFGPVNLRGHHAPGGGTPELPRT